MNRKIKILENMIRTEVRRQITEGKKAFKVNPPIGRAKYSISSHDGVKTHRDGSDFWDIEIFKNKVDLAKAIKKYKNDGFIEESANSRTEVRRQIQSESSEYGYKESNPKIELQYKDSKNKWHYLSSTNWASTVKQAVQKFIDRLENNPQSMKAYSKKVGEPIDVTRIRGFKQPK